MADKATLEERWRHRLRQARARYDQKSNIYAGLCAEAVHSPIGSDGSLALLQAHQRENEARAEYLRVLQIYQDLVGNGIVPDELPES